jgi:uncharacterized membrane protein YkoI
MKRSPANATRAQAVRRVPASSLATLLAALGLVAGAAAPLALHADGGGYRGRPALTLDEAVSRVRRETSARILSADTERVDGREEYRVRVLTDQGQVRGYRLDAGDGSFRSHERSGAPPRERRDRRNR